jgi:hypothetical protein
MVGEGEKRKLFFTHYFSLQALENGDLGEYSQCQTQIYDLHMHHKLPGCNLEFTAYRFLVRIEE